MSWISDVRSELKGLDTSRKSLRNFGLLVGCILIAIAVLFYLRGKHPMAAYICGPIGLFLIAGGALFPGGLRGIYRPWMGFAFALGWIVSRVLLSMLFYLVVTPTGLVARLSGKEFLDINMKRKKESYWIKKKDSAIQYEKMY